MDAVNAIETFLIERGSAPISREELIETVTGIRLLTREEERKVQIYSEAIPHMWASGQITLTEDRHIIPGYNLGRRPEPKT